MSSVQAGFFTTPSIINKIRLFGNHMFASLLEQVYEENGGRLIEWRDVALIYIESLARNEALSHGEKVGVIYFIENIKYKKEYLVFFGMLAINKDTFEIMENEILQIIKKGPGYIYEYYFNIHHPLEEITYMSADNNISSTINTNNAAEPGRIVYFWRVPKIESYS